MNDLPVCDSYLSVNLSVKSVNFISKEIIKEQTEWTKAKFWEFNFV